MLVDLTIDEINLINNLVKDNKNISPYMLPTFWALRSKIDCVLVAVKATEGEKYIFDSEAT